MFRGFVKSLGRGETRGITVDDKLRLAIDRSRSLISVIVRGRRGLEVGGGTILGVSNLSDRHDDDDEPCQLCPTKSAVI